MKSVCMATYNGSEFIKRQLDSIIKQLDVVDEVIIVDDNSSDDTIKIILDNYSSNQVRIIKNNRNIGSIKSFEKALSEAKGSTFF
nr:glycosyltransferase [Carnobacterium maltaromaticum]